MVVSLNATATVQLYNPSRFFGYHVKSSPVGLKYLDLSMAGGQVKQYRQIEFMLLVCLCVCACPKIWKLRSIVFEQPLNSWLWALSQLKSFFLEKRTTKKVTVVITADKQFLHGAGPSFDQSYSAPSGGVSMKLEGTIFTRAYVMGHMLKNKFSNNVACTFNFVAGGPTLWKVQQLACIYASS